LVNTRLSTLQRIRIFEILALVIAGAIIGYVAGHFRMAWLEDQHALKKQQLESLYNRVDQMEYQINILQVELDVERRATSTLQREIRSLLEDKELVNRELSFYQRVVSTDVSDGAGIGVDRFQVIQLPEENRYRVRIVLMQQGQIHEQVTGQVSLSLGFSGADGTEYMDLFDVMEEPVMSRNYRLSYYGVQEANFTLPETLEPETLRLHIRESSGQELTIEQAWQELLLEPHS